MMTLFAERQISQNYYWNKITPPTIFSAVIQIFVLKGNFNTGQKGKTFELRMIILFDTRHNRLIVDLVFLNHYNCLSQSFYPPGTLEISFRSRGIPVEINSSGVSGNIVPYIDSQWEECPVYRGINRSLVSCRWLCQLALGLELSRHNQMGAQSATAQGTPTAPGRTKRFYRNLSENGCALIYFYDHSHLWEMLYPTSLLLLLLVRLLPCAVFLFYFFSSNLHRLLT